MIILAFLGSLIMYLLIDVTAFLLAMILASLLFVGLRKVIPNFGEANLTIEQREDVDKEFDRVMCKVGIYAHIIFWSCLILYFS